MDVYFFLFFSSRTLLVLSSPRASTRMSVDATAFDASAAALDHQVTRCMIKKIVPHHTVFNAVVIVFATCLFMPFSHNFHGPLLLAGGDLERWRRSTSQRCSSY